MMKDQNLHTTTKDDTLVCDGSFKQKESEESVLDIPCSSSFKVLPHTLSKQLQRNIEKITNNHNNTNSKEVSGSNNKILDVEDIVKSIDCEIVETDSDGENDSEIFDDKKLSKEGKESLSLGHFDSTEESLAGVNILTAEIKTEGKELIDCKTVSDDEDVLEEKEKFRCQHSNNNVHKRVKKSRKSTRNKIKKKRSTAIGGGSSRKQERRRNKSYEEFYDGDDDSEDGNSSLNSQDDSINNDYEFFYNNIGDYNNNRNITSSSYDNYHYQSYDQQIYTQPSYHPHHSTISQNDHYVCDWENYYLQHHYPSYNQDNYHVPSSYDSNYNDAQHYNNNNNTTMSRENYNVNDLYNGMTAGDMGYHYHQNQDQTVAYASTNQSNITTTRERLKQESKYGNLFSEHDDNSKNRSGNSDSYDDISDSSDYSYYDSEEVLFDEDEDFMDLLSQTAWNFLHFIPNLFKSLYQKFNIMSLNGFNMKNNHFWFWVISFIRTNSETESDGGEEDKHRNIISSPPSTPSPLNTKNKGNNDQYSNNNLQSHTRNSILTMNSGNVSPDSINIKKGFLPRPKHHYFTPTSP